MIAIAMQDAHIVWVTASLAALMRGGYDVHASEGEPQPRAC